jgi:hypothetical protein
MSVRKLRPHDQLLAASAEIKQLPLTMALKIDRGRETRRDFRDRYNDINTIP